MYVTSVISPDNIYSAKNLDLQFISQAIRQKSHLHLQSRSAYIGQ